MNTDLENVIDDVNFPGAKGHHSGKIRESFILDEARRAIVVTDRISAFDFILGTVPNKGQVLNQIAAWWFDRLDEIGVPHHLIEVPHPNITLAKSVKTLPVEFVVRGYLTGTTTTSSWYAYNNHDRVICGQTMPVGMKKNEPFPEIMVTPSTKPDAASGLHDVNVSREQILEMGLVEVAVLDKAYEYALRMFAHGQKIAAERGLILVDTKYEMGLAPSGELIVIDEVHTPDSSRYWIAETYADRMAAGAEPDGLDKEFVRRMVVGAGYDVDSDENPANYFNDDMRVAAGQKYLELYDIMTGEGIQIDDSGEKGIVECLGRLIA